MIALIDYGVGNLFSLSSSLKEVGADVFLASRPGDLKNADRILLPGVGAFSDAMEKLRARGMDEAIREESQKGKPLLGICLGMQLLFEESHEYGTHKGLGLLPGKVLPLAGCIPEDLKIPHMGWNALSFTRPHPLWEAQPPAPHVYFVHSYYADCPGEILLARTHYGKPVTAAVGKDSVLGCQFHPEKSGRAGLSILRAFCRFSHFH